MNRFSPLAKIGKFQPEDPLQLAKQASLLESYAQRKAQNDGVTPPYTITTKQTGTYNARPWDIARMDTSAAPCFVILPDPLKNLGVWIGVKFAAGVTNNAATVSCVNSTIDGDSSYVLNIARQLVWFYATPDGWERGSTL